MSKPANMAELLKRIYFWVGLSFVVCGVLCFIGVLQPSERSMVQTQATLGIIFLSLGIVFFIVQSVLKAVGSRKNKLHDELFRNGARVNGTVEKVYLQRYVQYGKESPWVIGYTYTYQGKNYHHKSDFLWKKPDIKEEDSIAVYTDDSGRSAVRTCCSAGNCL